jgi:ATP-dependent protease ClpP protease subunit
MSKLIQLLASNRGRAVAAAKPFAVAGDVTTIYIYEPIVSSDIEAEFFGGVSAQSLVPQIRDIKGGTINLRINSPGGDVFAANAICAAIRDTGAKVVAYIDGVAASAATVIATAADEAIIADGAMYMIHKAWASATANADEMRELAGLLDKVDVTMCAQYSKKTGIPESEVMEMMRAETWFTSDQAVEKGFASAIASDRKVSASWDLSAYANAPQPAAHAEPEPEQIDAATEEHRARQRQRVSMMARLQIS